MKHIRLVVLFSLLTLLIAAGSALAGMQDFTLTNNSGSVITNLYVSPSGEDSWGEDVLGADVLEPGQAVNISFDNYNDACAWDIMVVDEDGAQSTIGGVDLCTTTDVTYQ